jgi:hypothetical protein
MVVILKIMMLINLVFYGSRFIYDYNWNDDSWANLTEIMRDFSIFCLAVFLLTC